MLVQLHDNVIDTLRAALPSDTEVLFLHKVSELLETLEHDELDDVPHDQDKMFQLEYMIRVSTLELNVTDDLCRECASHMLTAYAIRWEYEHGRWS